jgi:hypothetical protein
VLSKHYPSAEIAVIGKRHLIPAWKALQEEFPDLTFFFARNEFSYLTKLITSN